MVDVTVNSEPRARSRRSRAWVSVPHARRWVGFFVLLIVNVFGTSCASVPRQTPSMNTAPEIKVDAAELRVRMYDYQNRFATVVQSTADAILDNERDLGVQEAAIRWKVGAIPAMEKAVFVTDPLVALGDGWVLTIAMARFFDEGAGQGVFGTSQNLAVEAAHRLEVEMDALARSLMGSSPAARARTELERWAGDHPIEDLSFGRRSAMVDDSAVTAAGLRVGGLQAVGQIEATARDLSERLTVYFERLPKQMRWNAELVVIEVMQEFGYPVIRDIDSINVSAQGVRSFLDDTPNLIRSEREAVLSSFQTELGAALGSVDRQRVETLSTLEVERRAILETLATELDVGLAAVRQERIEALAELERLSIKTIEESTRNAERLAEHLIDRLFWRALAILVLAFALGTIGWILVRRLGAGTRHISN